ncbi:MAG: hypothetical protein HWE14_07295 [Flavobacteriia bacterium]|nr:hypothetical protein [Flavobacteriia bacterium]
MKSRIYTAVFVLMSSIAFAQYYEPMSRRSSGSSDSSSTESTANNIPTDVSQRSFGQRLLYGGSLQLSFGSVTYVELAPRVGYLVTNDLIAGVGINYIYVRYAENISYPGSPAVDFSLYGGNVYSTYNVPIGLPIALHGEFEAMNLELWNPAEFQYQREWVPALRLGAAYVQRIGSGGGVYLMALYDVLHDPDRSLNPYSPWTFRISFMF